MLPAETTQSRRFTAVSSSMAVSKRLVPSWAPSGSFSATTATVRSLAVCAKPQASASPTATVSVAPGLATRGRAPERVVRA